MKRSNRLVLLIGVFLAVIAFIAIIVIGPGGGGGGGTPPPTTQKTVVAAVDIPLGVKVTADMVTNKDLLPEQRSTTAFGDPSQVVGRIVRQPVVTGAQLTAETFGESTAGTIGDIEVPPTKRAITVQVDQVTGVGTTIKPGDYVDMVVGI